MAVLFEEWAKCSEDWQQSDFVIRMRERTTDRQRGGRRWMTKGDIITKYLPGRSQEEAQSIAEEIILNKESTPELIKPHPDAPLNESMKLFLVWDEAFVSTTVDHVVDTLFRQKDASNGPKGKPSKKRKQPSDSSGSDQQDSEDES